MTRILVVCLGNICRSPLAHGILKSKLPENRFSIDSAGTAAYHIGKSPDYRSILVAKNNGIDISSQSARQFKYSDFETHDVIYAMDQVNYNDIISLAQNNGNIEKVKLFLNANTSITHKNVPDPYYGNINDFERVFSLIDDTSDLIAKALLRT